MTTHAGIRKTFTGDHVLQYDQKSQQANWLDPDVVFGLAYRYVRPGESILDVGIGTGLSSALFHDAGLRVSGLDFSTEMLEICRAKAIAQDLKEHDLAVAPYPLADGSVDHAVCTGVTHLFEDLGVIFAETARIMKSGGIFAFVVAHPEPGGENKQAIGCCKELPEKALFHFHSESSMDKVYGQCGFKLVNSLRFISASIGRRERTFRACVAQKL